MKKILIIHSNMELGGAETSLLGLLSSLDYTKISADLFLMDSVGELMRQIPPQVNILSPIPAYQALVRPIKQSIKSGHFGIAAARLWSKMEYSIINRKHCFRDRGYVIKQMYHKKALPFLPKFEQKYDAAISFNDPHYILGNKVHADVKIGWFHTDFSKIDTLPEYENEAWKNCDYIVNVSTNCKLAFDAVHPALAEKSIVLENVLSKQLIVDRSKDTFPVKETTFNGLKLLSIGRFCEAKNFDNVPDICKRIVESGMDVKWYIIGFGGDETLIRQKITEAGMEERVILLGKKDNPYPYLAACDLYVQPSRYEGKCVAVREAQMLGKPVVITRYATSASQLEENVDGVIVPMDNTGCAEGIVDLLRDPERMRQLADTCRQRDYTNAGEAEKLYKLL